MRQAIETAPRDGQVVILEDDATGTYDVVHWSAEAGEWVGENSEPSKITPTHWHPMPRDKYPHQKHDESSGPSQARPPAPRTRHTPRARRRFAASSIAATVIAAALSGMYFRSEVVAAYLTRYAPSQDTFEVAMGARQIGAQQTQLPSQDSSSQDSQSPKPQQADSSARDSTALQQPAEADRAGAEAREAAQVKQTAEAAAQEARQSLEKQSLQKAQLPEVSADEIALAQRTIEGRSQHLWSVAEAAQSLEQEREQVTALIAAAQRELTASIMQHRQALAEERDRGDALARELAMARSDIETKVVLLNKAGDEAAQLKQTADATAAELQQERDKSAARASELATARRDIKTMVAQSSKAGGEAAQLKQAAAATQELRQALQQERDKAATLASELATARRDIESKAALLSKADGEAAQLKQTAKATAAELQQKRDKAAALASELATARRDIETQVALSSKAGEEAAQLKQAATATQELRQALQQERDKAATLASELATARRDSESKAALLSKADGEAAQLKQTVEATAAELQQKRDKAAALASELATARRDIESQAAQSGKAGDEAAQLEQAATATQELRQALQQERDKTATLASELATARRDIESQVALSSKAGDEAAQLKQAAAATQELRQALQLERDKTATLASELATARRDIESQAAQSGKAGDEAAQLKQAAERTTTELQQSLQQERDKAAALASDLAAARRDSEIKAALLGMADDRVTELKQAAERTTAELRQSLQQERDKAAALAGELTTAGRDIDIKAALLSMAADEAAQLKRAAEAATAELRQSLQQERDRATALARDLESARRVNNARTAEPAASSRIEAVKQVAEAVAEQPAAAEAQASPEAAKLMALASTLLSQGNIGAARIVLERAAETGSAKASFALAETYDPHILASWGTYGTLGDATKARELYAKAEASGIREAKDRFNALRQ